MTKPEYIDPDEHAQALATPQARAAKAREAKAHMPPHSMKGKRNFSALAWIREMFRTPYGETDSDKTEDRKALYLERTRRWRYVVHHRRDKIVYQLLVMGWTGEKVLEGLNISGKEWQKIHDRLRSSEHRIRYSDHPVTFWQALEVDRYEYVIASLMERGEYKKAADVQDQLLTNLKTWGIITADMGPGGITDFLKAIGEAYEKAKGIKPESVPELAHVTKEDKPTLQ